MQFVSDGPDIPEALLQAHEEGRVVFFCGAGVSYPAGLPTFGGLVERIYESVGTTFSSAEREVFDQWRYDAALDLLERRLPGQRSDVRRAILKVLKPNLRKKGATDTHSALLRLGTDRKGVTRLVTTNFDRLFHKAARRSGQGFSEYAAPMLPLPKKSRWDGLVFLHGLLPKKADDAALNSLVITSGDFGLAYLIDRWAARFVSELLKNYVVCFVGYSINDPVMRYMMDALAADRMLGESTPQAWAFGDSKPGQEDAKRIEWEAKGVTPIIYRVSSGAHDHSLLHQTIHAWSDIYRDGVLGKERIVVQFASSVPQDSTLQENYVGRMLWAVLDSTGLPAKRFADLSPTPSLDWFLEALADKMRCDLCSLTVASARTPPILAENVKGHLFRWLASHWADPRLLLWVVQHSVESSSPLARLVDTELARADVTGDADSNHWMRTLWRLFLCGRMKSQRSDLRIFRWKERLKDEKVTSIARLELREILSPRISLRKPLNVWKGVTDGGRAAQLRRIVDWELVLATDSVHAIRSDQADEHWKAALPHLLEEFQQLLRDALDLLRELHEDDYFQDLSHWDLPSIEPHPQNRSFNDWVVLIELLRDSWISLRGVDAQRATRAARSWFNLPYPAFKRLALFAASHDVSISPDEWVDWLLSDNARWLWAPETGREAFRLFVLQGRRLGGDSQERLEATILAGPLRSMYRDEMEPLDWQNLVERGVWLRLAKLRLSGMELGADAAARLEALAESHPMWHLEPDERDEFSVWMSGTGDPRFEDIREIELAPRKRPELVEWLRRPLPLGRRSFYKDTWRDVCRTRFFHCLLALCDLAKENTWPKERWREALQTWSEDEMTQKSWRYAAPLVVTMPDTVFEELASSISWWMKQASKHPEELPEAFLKLCRRILDLPPETDARLTVGAQTAEGALNEALNHPVGQVAQALINHWFQRKPGDKEGLPSDLEPIFIRLCDVTEPRFRNGRVFLGSHLISLFRVDEAWSHQYLLPRFDWDEDLAEARSVWAGFLWSPRLYPPLLRAFKSSFLATAIHYGELGTLGDQYAAFLTYAALEPVDGYTMDEFRTAIGSLPSKGLEICAKTLAQALEGAADKREEFWKNRVQPFWQTIWPKDRKLITPRISESVARLAIAAGDEFPAALSAVNSWLQPLGSPNYVVHLLFESKLCERFPAEALSLLACVIKEQQWVPKELEGCLQEVGNVSPSLREDARYKGLQEYIQMRG